MTAGVDVIFEVMNTQIALTCPDCHSSHSSHSTSLKKNGKKSYGKQNYQCKDCNRQFIGDHALSYKGCHSTIENRIRLMLVRGCGIRDIAEITSVSIGKVLSTIQDRACQLTPKRQYYQRLEVDELWTYVGKKKRKVWLIYAYDRHTGEIVAYVWGKRDLKTAKKLRTRLKQLKVSYDCIAMDNWDSFITAFKADNKRVGKQHTVGIEGNNCRIRQRLRRAFRKTCGFSKKLDNHFKTFDMLFFYINYGHVRQQHTF